MSRARRGRDTSTTFTHYPTPTLQGGCGRSSIYIFSPGPPPTCGVPLSAARTPPRGFSNINNALPFPLAHPLQISDKNCEKIHYIAPNVYCCGAGTAADTENITKLISSQLELLRLQTGTESRVVAAMTQLKRRLFQYQGQISAALVLGGVDATGPHLYTIYPHGSTDKLPYVTRGSGSLAAMSVLEGGFKDDLTEGEAITLVAAAIRAGIWNDLGSGSNVDVTVIRGVAPSGGAAGGVKGGRHAEVTVLRNYETPNDVGPLRKRIQRPAARMIPRGATVVLTETFVPAIKKAGAAAAAGAAAGAAMEED